MPTIVPGKKIRPVVLVESTRAIIPERKERRMVGAAASRAVAPSASVASIRARASCISSPRRLGGAAEAGLGVPVNQAPTGAKESGGGLKKPRGATGPG